MLPKTAKMRFGVRKRMLRDVARGMFPAALAKREQQRLTLPLARWLRRDLKPWAAARLLDKRELDLWFSKAAVEKLWQDHQKKRHDNSLQLYTVAVFSSWLAQQKGTR